MNNVTDITILIAVIALALWPITLFALRIIHERKKKLEHIERMSRNELDVFNEISHFLSIHCSILLL